MLSPKQGVSRQDFLRGIAASLGLGAFGGWRIFAAPPGWKPPHKPNLVFGVISDTHLRTTANGNYSKGYWSDKWLVAALKCFADVLTPENGIATLNSQRRKGDYVIDYIMMDRAYRDAFRVDGAWLVEERKASDHAPLVVKIAPARTKRKPSGGGD